MADWPLPERLVPKELPQPLERRSSAPAAPPTRKLRRILADLDASSGSEYCESIASRSRGRVEGLGAEDGDRWARTSSDDLSSLESSTESDGGSGPLRSLSDWILRASNDLAVRPRPASLPGAAPPPASSSRSRVGAQSPAGVRAAPPPGCAPARPRVRRVPLVGPEGDAVKAQFPQRPTRPSGKAAPPAPPPPTGGKAVGKGSPGSQLPLGRRLQLRSSRSGAEAFKGLGNSTEVVDFSALQNSFSPKAQASKALAKRKVRRVELLPRNIAQNLAIILARLSVDPSELARVLEGSNLASVRALPEEDIRRLGDAWPTLEVLEPLMSYVQRGEDPSRLRDVERRLLPLAAMPRVKQRLRLVTLVSGLDERVDDSLAMLTRLQRGCSELQVSPTFREILSVVVVLFNYINFGKEVKASGGDCSGVDVQTLLQLKETKASNGDFPGFNMLHFVLRQIVRQKPDLKSRQFCEELASLPRASQVSLDRLHEGVRELRRDRDFVREELRVALGLRDQEGLEDRADDEMLALPPVSRRNLLSMLLNKGLELAAFATAWVQGSEVLGQPYHPCVAASGFEAVLADDGEAPPPGWLWFRRPQGAWNRCWCEIQGSVLVLYKVKDNSCKGAIYLALPAAVISLLEPVAAPEVESKPRGGEQPAQGACSPERCPGFEIRSVDGSELCFRAGGGQREADRWVATLQRQISAPGAGFLAIAETSNQVLGASPRRYYCVVVGDELIGFKRPRDGLEGSPPQRVWNLEGSAVRGLQAAGSASVSPRRSRRATLAFGFEIEELQSGRAWRFVCDSYVEERTWLQRLQERERSGDVGDNDAGKRPKLLAIEDADAVSEASEGGHVGDLVESSSEESDVEDGPVGLLRYLDKQLSDRISSLSRVLTAAEMDCKGLLKYFGLEVPRNEQLGNAIARFLEAMSEFVRRAKGAWDELDRHQQAQDLRARAQKRAQKHHHKPSKHGSRSEQPSSPSPQQPLPQLWTGELRLDPVEPAPEPSPEVRSAEPAPQSPQSPSNQFPDSVFVRRFSPDEDPPTDSLSSPEKQAAVARDAESPKSPEQEERWWLEHQKQEEQWWGQSPSASSSQQQQRQLQPRSPKAGQQPQPLPQLQQQEQQRQQPQAEASGSDTWLHSRELELVPDALPEEGSRAAVEVRPLSSSLLGELQLELQRVEEQNLLREEDAPESSDTTLSEVEASQTPPVDSPRRPAGESEAPEGQLLEPPSPQAEADRSPMQAAGERLELVPFDAVDRERGPAASWSDVAPAGGRLAVPVK